VALIDDFECGVSVFGKAVKLRRVLSRNETPPGESIYVGDEIRDIEAAQDAGMAFGAVSWGYNRIEALRAHSPSEVFSSVSEILEKITCET
jgi:phosphoglycolate phosphatase